MAQSPKYPNHQILPPAYERQVWPPEGLSDEKRHRLSRMPYLGEKLKMTKKARLRTRAYHHVLTRRRGDVVEVVMGDCIQGFRHNNVLQRSFRKIDSGWVTYATHNMSEQFQDASYERRSAPWGVGVDRGEVLNVGDQDDTVSGGPTTLDLLQDLRDQLHAAKEVARD